MSSTREKILFHALSLLKKRGYYGWSYDHISKEVKIKKASIHYYFPSKEDLVTEVLKAYIEDFYAQLHKISSVEGLNIEKLQKLFLLFQTICESKEEICLCTLMASDHFTLSSEGKQILEKFYIRLKKWIENVLFLGKEEKEFRNDLNCNKTADLFVSCLQGLMVTSKINQTTQFVNCQESLLSILK